MKHTPHWLAIASLQAGLALAAALPMAATAADAATAPATAATPAVDAVRPAATSGLDPAAFDTAVRPQDNLFQHANGVWLKNTPIPADQPDYGVAQELADRAKERVRQIGEAGIGDSVAPGSVEQKIGTYYRSFLDEAAIDRAGLAPLAPWFAEVEALKTPAELVALWGRWQGIAQGPIGIAVYGDPKDPGTDRLSLWQDGLGLPDRDYYLQEDAHFKKARAAYLEHLQALFTLSGDAQAAAHAQTVYALEKKLARVQWSQVDSRDALKTYNPRTLATLGKQSRGIDWNGYFQASAITAKIDRLSVAQPSYLKALAGLVKQTPLADWKLYQRARLLDAHADELPKGFRDADFAYHGRALHGVEQAKPRWQEATRALNGALGEAVGQIYVSRHFPPENKARTQALVSNLMASYALSIDTVTWLGPQTKLRAKEKLSKYTTKIGYPDQWRDYSALRVTEGDAFGNSIRAGRFEHERQAAKVGRPVDRSEWGMTPQTVNAYYEPSRNEIAFPAAILDEPYFGLSYDDAVNYGAIGATIGHEISHGFDDQGSQYDGDGVLRNWWTPADRKAYDALSKRLVKQFDRYEPIAGHHINGQLTLGENIADLAGLEIAYKAYHLSLGGQPAPVINGLSGDQRFFLSYAVSWREKTRDALALQLLTNNEHAPALFRTNGAVVNMDAYHEAFGTKPGDAMYLAPAERIHLW